MSAFQKAVKSKSKLRCAVFGPPGAGKTYSALAIASGLAGKIALIDSERSSASKYADRFDFDTVDLQKKNIDEYIRYIGDAGKAGYDVLVIDSLSHAWQELLQEVEKLAQTKFRGNTWSAWSEGTPKQKALVDAILSFPGHVIATMRSKVEYIVTENDRGKTAPKKIGLSPEQGKGIEYEFDLLIEINQDHYATVTKDRTGKFQDSIIERPGIDFGNDLALWLNSGIERASQTLSTPQVTSQQQAVPANLNPKTGELFDLEDLHQPTDANGHVITHTLLNDEKNGLISALGRANTVDKVNQLRDWWDSKKGRMPPELHQFGFKVIGRREDALLSLRRAG